MEIYSTERPYPGMTYPWQWDHTYFPIQTGMSPWTMAGAPSYPSYPGFQPGGGAPGFPGLGPWMGWPWSMMPSPGGQPGWPVSWTRGWDGSGNCRDCQSNPPFAPWTSWTSWWGVPPMYNEVPSWSYPGEPTAPSASPYSAREADSEQPTAYYQFDPAGEPLWESVESPESPWIQTPEMENVGAEDSTDPHENG
jgi:hypothetical protein